MFALMNLERKVEEETRVSNDRETEAGAKHSPTWTKNSLCSHKHGSHFPLICFLILPFKIFLTDCLQYIVWPLSIFCIKAITHYKTNGRNKILNYI